MTNRDAMRGPLVPSPLFLPLPLRERAGVRGFCPWMFSHCHPGLFLLVIPDVSHPVIPDFSHAVIPDVINRESKGRAEGGPEGAVEARPSCEAFTTEQKEKDPGFPLTDGGKDRVGAAERTGGGGGKDRWRTGMTGRGGYDAGLLP